MLTRGHVESLTQQLQQKAIVARTAFDAALDHKDVDEAAAIALAALNADAPLELEAVVKIAGDVSVPDVLLPLFARGKGSLEPLLPALELDEHRGALVLTAEVFKLTGKAPKWLTHAVADAIDKSLTDSGYELLVACAYQLDEPTLFAVRHSVKTYLNAADARDVWGTVKRDVAKPLGILPEHELSLPVVSVRKGGDEPGRNDPCPCGSGQKYKKCHGAAGGELAPKGRAERLAELLPKLEPKHVAALTSTDLAQLDLAKLPIKVATAVFREWMYRKRWHQAEVALEQLCVHPERTLHPDGYRDEYIWQALQGGRLADAQRQHAKVAKPDELTPVLDIHAALLGQWPAWLELIEDVCVDAAQTGQLADLLDLTYVLLQRAPGLGLWLSTSVYPKVKEVEAQTLYGSMDDARDRLGLAELSPRAGRQRVRAQEPSKSAAPKPTDAKEKAKIRELESTLEESKKKMRQIEQALTKERARASVEPAVPAPPPGARKAFAERIDELEERIREGNAERARLRKEVGELTERLESGKAAVLPKPAEPTADEPGEGATRPRGLLLAQWEPRAIESLEELPARVSEDVLVKVAELGGGDPAHWIEVKQLQGVAGLYTARIGIHYRVLFTLESKVLRVHEVVHREGFDTALRRFK